MNRAPAPAQALLLAACAWAWLPACGLNQGGVAPPDDTIAYPASAVLDRDSDWLFVTNSNADLRYNDGTVLAFSLTRALIDRTPNPAPPEKPLHDEWGDCPQVDYPNPRSDNEHFCCWDLLDRNILNCDERYYIGSDTEADPMSVDHKDSQARGTGNVRIGSFAAGIVLQEPGCAKLQPNPNYDPNDPQSSPLVDCTGCAMADFSNTDDRLLLGVRGDTSLTFVDTRSRGAATPPRLRCLGDARMPVEGDFATCDDAHRIVQAASALAAPTDHPEDQPVIPLPDEPYALAIDKTAGLLYIGHLTGSSTRPLSGGFSLFDIAPLGDGSSHGDGSSLPQPRFIAPFPSPFPASSLGGLGITAFTVQTDRFGLTQSVFASSRFVPAVAGLGSTATCPGTTANPIREIAAFQNASTFGSPLGGAEMRGIQFFDFDGDGYQERAFALERTPPALISFYTPTAAATDIIETCDSPTFLDQHTNSAGLTRLFVTCFAAGEIDVFDPTVPTLVKTFSAGRGPSGFAFDRNLNRPVAYIVGFGDNNISVVNLEPGSPTEYHVIQRIGFPRTSPR